MLQDWIRSLRRLSLVWFDEFRVAPVSRLSVEMMLRTKRRSKKVLELEGVVGGGATRGVATGKDTEDR